MKREGILFAFLMLLGCVQGYAQKQGWNADTIMQRVKRTEQTYFAFQLKMNMTSIADDGIATHRTVEISWQADRMNVSDYDSTGKLRGQIIGLADTIWSYGAKANEITISYGHRPKNMGSGLGFYTMTVDRSKGVLKEIIGDTVAIISFYPANPEKESWNQLDLRINLKTYQSIGYVKYQKDGGRTICDLEYTSINQAFNPDLFLFDLKNYPADVKVIENRHQ